MKEADAWDYAEASDDEIAAAFEIAFTGQPRQRLIDYVRVHEQGPAGPPVTVIPVASKSTENGGGGGGGGRGLLGIEAALLFLRPRRRRSAPS